MIINQREIILTSYSTELNWYSDITQSNWVIIIINHEMQGDHIKEVVSKLLRNNVRWICTVGRSSELIHDIIDEEIAYRSVDIDFKQPSLHELITTWHFDIHEGIWFGIFAAVFENVGIDKVLILDMTKGEETENIKRLVEEFQLIV